VALQNARLFDSVRRHREDLQQLSNQIFQAQEAERGRIARELHDGIGQILTGIKMNLESTARTLPDGSLQDRPQLTDAINLTARAIGDLRNISLDLRPSMLDDLGLSPTLNWLCAEVGRRHGLEVRCSIEVHDESIPDPTETAVYRIVQEALGNIVKHAKATEARVDIMKVGDLLRLSILDNGEGFDVNDLPRWQAERQCSGILNMKERAGLLGGTFNLSSTPGEGTLLSFSIPLTGRVRK
jgi:signal transduction histidine kinase